MTSTPPHSSPSHNSAFRTAEIPIEIIPEEEMALIEAALAAAAAAMPSAPVCRNAKSIRSITLMSKRGLSACTDNRSSDIEDCGRVVGSNSPNKSKKIRESEPLLYRFRRGRGLSVTDLTATEWCEKQMEYTLFFGKPKATKVMLAGSARHAVLEEEVIQRVKVNVESAEDVWALKLMNFIVGANQLLFDGLTRELPLVGLVEGVWMVGMLDEVRMSQTERIPVLVDTKTRGKPTLPREPQKRNGRLQLMCYKYMWDSLVTNKFPSQKFFDFFSLNPNKILSQKIRENAAGSGFASETLIDVVRYFGNSCCLLPQAHDRLLLRYELQEDQSLLGEDEFPYELDWLKDKIKSSHDFWLGKREAEYAPIEERWKCGYCTFSSACPANSIPPGSPSKTVIEYTQQDRDQSH
ncbi:exonuclease V, chloroplastic-like [Andrographis paniculata]|uniref:exonuclease V, chloroplastic-like n=1 Tax=Andrographis paniculata TaxID=175694 RepID=UPI0021E8BE7A|nr:exonuclease V, chloroplastic-like [Andrographis paniculata]